MEQLSPAIALFVREDIPRAQAGGLVQDYALAARMDSLHRVPVLDLYADLCTVEKTLSGDAAVAAFDAAGNLCRGHWEPVPGANFRKVPLAEILRQQFPKTE